VGLEEYSIGFTELFVGHEHIINCGKEEKKCNEKFCYLRTEPKEDKCANE